LTICQIGADFETKIKGEFDKMIERHDAGAPAG